MRRLTDLHAARQGSALRAPDQGRAHDLRAPVRLRRRAARGRRGPVGSRPALDHRRHGRRSLARDGAQPADRRGHRRAEPAHRRPRDPVREAERSSRCCVFCLASLLVFLVAVWQLNPVVRWLWPIPVVVFVDLPVPQALHVDVPPLARRGRRPRPGGRVGGDHREAAVAGVGARRRGRNLGRRVRHLLLALRRRDRPRAGPPLLGRALRRARRVRRRAADARRDGRRCSSPPASGSTVDGWYWAGVIAVAGLLFWEHTLVRPGRPATARRRVLHHERRDQRRVLRVRLSRRPLSCPPWSRRRS